MLSFAAELNPAIGEHDVEKNIILPGVKRAVMAECDAKAAALRAALEELQLEEEQLS